MQTLPDMMKVLLAAIALLALLAGCTPLQKAPWHYEAEADPHTGRWTHSLRSHADPTGMHLILQCREGEALMIWMDHRILGGVLQIDNLPERPYEASYGRIIHIQGGIHEAVEEMKRGRTLRIEAREEKTLGKYEIHTGQHQFSLQSFSKGIDHISEHCKMP